jgi:hypothetical protein
MTSKFGRAIRDELCFNTEVYSNESLKQQINHRIYENWFQLVTFYRIRGDVWVGGMESTYDI